MGKLKIIAKSHMLSKTAPIFLTFAVCISVFIICGDLSLFVSYAIELSSLKDMLSQEKQVIILTVFSLVGILLFIALSAPLKLGRERWFMLNAKGKEPKAKELLYYFSKKRYLRSVSAWCFAIALKLGCALLFFFPAICLTGVIVYCLISSSTAYPIVLCLIAADIVLVLLGAVFMFIYNGEFLLYYPIIVSTENLSVSQAYSYSKDMTCTSLFKIAAFRLSFAPWWLLCLLIIPTFYSWGYYKQSLSELAYRNEYLT